MLVKKNYKNNKLEGEYIDYYRFDMAQFFHYHCILKMMYPYHKIQMEILTDIQMISHVCQRIKPSFYYLQLGIIQTQNGAYHNPLRF